jgi:hypothetical protein
MLAAAISEVSVPEYRLKQLCIVPARRLLHLTEPATTLERVAHPAGAEHVARGRTTTHSNRGDVVIDA